jgi:hypothetical protein
MDISVDGQPLADVPSNIATLGQLAVHVKQHLDSPDRLVVGIAADGENIEAESLEPAMTKPLATWSRIDFETTSAAEASLAVLHGANALFEEAEGIQHETVELLRQGEDVRARESMVRCFAIWQQTQESVSKVRELLDLDLDSMKLDDEPYPEIFSQLRDRLEEIKDALAARDYVLLADILEYELQETTNKWRRIIARLIDLTSG